MLIISAKLERWGERGILCLFVLTALFFASGPIFEAPDEIEHYRYTRTIARTGALPDPREQIHGEYHQAPLYYMLLAPLIHPLPDEDFAQIEARRNPFYPYLPGIPGSDNKNVYLHEQDEAEFLPASQTARAVRILRVATLTLGIGTLLICRAIFHLLWEHKPERRLLGFTVVACWAQYVYLSSAINNDNLLILLSTFILWRLLLMLRDGLDLRAALVIGIACGAALLTKVNAGFLFFPVVLAFALRRDTWKWLPAAAVCVILVSGWWYARNLMLLGEPTGISAALITWQDEQINDGRLALDIGLPRAAYGYQTLWAAFGHGTVGVSPLLYRFYDLVTIVGVLGYALVCAVRLRRAPSLQIHYGLVITLYALIWVAVLIYSASTAWSGNQGRYLLPGIIAWSVMIVYGWTAMSSIRIRSVSAFIVSICLVGALLITLFSYFLPAFRIAPVPNNVAQNPPLYRYSDTAELITVDPQQVEASPGELVNITLYWRSLSPSSPTLQIFLHSQETNLIRRDSLPGTGNLLASDWSPGLTWAETYAILIPADAPTGATLTLIAGLYDPATGQNIEPVDGRLPVIGSLHISG